MLKIVGTYYIARITKSPAGAVIGPVVGILVWIDLVARYLLFCVAWAATADRPGTPAPEVDDEPADDGQAVGGVPSPVGVAVGLVSAGAALGAGALAWQQRRERQRRTAG